MDFENNFILIENLRIGEEKAYAFLVDKYHQRLLGYAYGLVQDRTEAQDLVQNVFLKTWKYRTKLDHQFSLQSFLYKSLYNDFINSYKKKKAHNILQLKYYQTLSQTVEDIDESALSKMMEVVNLEIQNLPDKCREVFLLSRREGLTNKEISDFMKISIKSVEGHITKAFKTLRRELGESYQVVLLVFFFPKEILDKSTTQYRANRCLLHDFD